MIIENTATVDALIRSLQMFNCKRLHVKCRFESQSHHTSTLLCLLMSTVMMQSFWQLTFVTTNYSPSDSEVNFKGEKPFFTRMTCNLLLSVSRDMAISSYKEWQCTERNAKTMHIIIILILCVCSFSSCSSDANKKRGGSGWRCHQGSNFTNRHSR